MTNIKAITYFVFLMVLSASARDLSRPPLRIEGSKISDSMQVRKMAMDAYMEKMNYKLSATAHAEVACIVVLGFDFMNFCKKGEPIWEIRITNLEELRAIIWVHPNTGKMYFLFAPPDSLILHDKFMTLSEIRNAREQYLKSRKSLVHIKYVPEVRSGLDLNNKLYESEHSKTNRITEAKQKSAKNPKKVVSRGTTVDATESQQDWRLLFVIGGAIALLFVLIAIRAIKRR